MKLLAIAAGLLALSTVATAQSYAPAGAVLTADSSPSYIVVDLGHLAPATRGHTLPRAIQNGPATTVTAGPMIVGSSSGTQAMPRPFIWTPAWGMIDGMAGLPGTGEAFAVNAFGDYVGAFTPATGAITGPQRAFLASTRMSAIHYLPTLGGSHAAAHGINNSMVIAGWSNDAANQRRATVWRDSGNIIVDLGTLGGSHAEAFAINDFGQTVGRAQRADDVYRAFLHNPISVTPLIMTDLGSLWVHGGSVARDISNNGFIVGSSEFRGPVTAPSSRGQQRATIWEGNIIIDMGTLHPLDPGSEALAVNSHGHAVGWSGSSRLAPTLTSVHQGQRAFIWMGHQMRDLNGLIPANSGWVLQSAEDINDAGMIIGWGTRVMSTTVEADVRGFLLIPQRP
jgi:probable HAF family extracellular repeat protein